MGRVKIARKSTFIDMTAMSDVTVLLLTFFMLTSTFLQKEPVTVVTPPSVSTEKVQETNFVQVLQPGRKGLAYYEQRHLICLEQREDENGAARQGKRNLQRIA